MVEYILDDTPKTPFAIKHIEMVSIILSVLVGVVVGVCFWDSVGEEKVAFIMALVAGVLLLMNGFTFIIDICYRR